MAATTASALSASPRSAPLQRADHAVVRALRRNEDVAPLPEGRDQFGGPSAADVAVDVQRVEVGPAHVAGEVRASDVPGQGDPGRPAVEDIDSHPGSLRRVTVSRFEIERVAHPCRSLAEAAGLANAEVLQRYSARSRREG